MTTAVWSGLAAYAGDIFTSFTASYDSVALERGYGHSSVSVSVSMKGSIFTPMVEIGVSGTYYDEYGNYQTHTISVSVNLYAIAVVGAICVAAPEIIPGIVTAATAFASNFPSQAVTVP